MYEVIFLIIIAIAWIILASIQDLRQREVADWLNFSLIIFALGFRFFYSVFSEAGLGGFNFFYQGLIGFGIFFIIGNALYYGRMFAGADAKLMMALGAILPFSNNLIANLEIFFFFFIVFFIAGGFYGLVFSVFLSARNYKPFGKEFSKQFTKNKRLVQTVMILGLVLMLFGFLESIVFYLGIILFIFPYLFLFAKSVDESCMIKKIQTKKLREGDWLYNSLKLGKKRIKPAWAGLTKKEIALIKRHKKTIKIREGIPFIPVFLIAFIILVISYFSGNLGILWNSIW